LIISVELGYLRAFALRNERSDISLQFLLSQKLRDSSQDSASLSRRAAGLGTWRCKCMEVRCRRVDVEV